MEGHVADRFIPGRHGGYYQFMPPAPYTAPDLTAEQAAAMMSAYLGARLRTWEHWPSDTGRMTDFGELGQLPHCDSRVLHAPAECEYCDHHPEWQALREAWGIAFTGHAPTGDQVPCPADAARPPGSPSDAHRWGGNRPTHVAAEKLPEQSAASRMMYEGLPVSGGYPGGRPASSIGPPVRMPSGAVRPGGADPADYPAGPRSGMIERFGARMRGVRGFPRPPRQGE
jgi:hypothetical protein